MLVLSRRQEESIVITTPNGEEIHILVLDSTTDSTRLGIHAPSDYLITREELLSENITIT